MSVLHSLAAFEQNLQPVDLNIFEHYPCMDRLTYVFSEFITCPQANSFFKNLSDISFACITREDDLWKDFKIVNVDSALKLAFDENTTPKEMFNSLNSGLHIWNNYKESAEIIRSCCDYNPREYIKKLASLSYKISVNINKLIESCIKEKHWDPEFNGATLEKIQPFEQYLEEQLSAAKSDSLRQNWFKKCSEEGFLQAKHEASTRPVALFPNNKTASY